MIKTDIDIKDDIYGWLSGSALVGLISGKVYKDARPMNSDKEDIVISVLARDAGPQVQYATVNINIYVPDLRRGQEAVEDIPRLRTLSTSAATLLEYKNANGAVYELDSQEILAVNGTDWHVINNQMKIRYNNE